MRFATLLTVAGICAASASARAQSAVPAFEAAVKRVAFFDVGEFIYRPDRRWKPKDEAAYKASQQALAEAVKTPLSRSELAGELKNPDARVRTLALAALFAREDPHDLPRIVALADDTAPTFPGYGELSPDWLRTTSIGPPPHDQTVGDVAKRMGNLYLKLAGFAYGVKGSGREPGFAAYWQERKDRAFCASWFAVKLARASRAVSPTRPEYLPDVRRVRAAIDALPRNDRNWTLLYLHGESGSDALASDDEFEEAANELLDAHKADFAKHLPVSADPDISPYKRGPRWDEMERFIVRHSHTTSSESR